MKRPEGLVRSSYTYPVRIEECFIPVCLHLGPKKFPLLPTVTSSSSESVLCAMHVNAPSVLPVKLVDDGAPLLFWRFDRSVLPGQIAA